VPLRRLARAATEGGGLSSAWHAVAATDAVVTSEHVPNPAGDIRLAADASQARRLASDPGWAWAPVDEMTKGGQPHPCCPRHFLRRMTARCGSAGLELRVGAEVEWFLASGSPPDWRPAHEGPAVGANVLMELGDYVCSLVDALGEEGLGIEAIDAEYANGQLELALSPMPAVAAAHASVLTRLTIHSVSRRHGCRASFSPAFSGLMGNEAISM
jgi:glutamine synthetase